MTDLNWSTRYYRRRFDKKEAEFNAPRHLPPYFKDMIGKKKQVLIAELGAGPVNTIGNLWNGVDVRIIASDRYADEYKKFWDYWGKTPIVPIEYQDMEALTYKDNLFDIVHCENALDHTPDAKKALSEMIRVCRKGGYVYLRHFKNQRTRAGFRKGHEWDISGRNFNNTKETFTLGDEWDVKEENDVITAILHI